MKIKTMIRFLDIIASFEGASQDANAACSKTNRFRHACREPQFPSAATQDATDSQGSESVRKETCGFLRANAARASTGTANEGELAAGDDGPCIVTMTVWRAA